MYALKVIMLLSWYLPDMCCDADTSTTTSQPNGNRTCSSFPYHPSLCRLLTNMKIPSFYKSGDTCCYFLQDTWQCASSTATFDSSLIHCFHELIPLSTTAAITICCDNPPYATAYDILGRTVSTSDDYCNDTLSTYVDERIGNDSDCQQLRVWPSTG